MPLAHKSSVLLRGIKGHCLIAPYRLRADPLDQMMPNLCYILTKMASGKMTSCNFNHLSLSLVVSIPGVALCFNYYMLEFKMIHMEPFQRPESAFLNPAGTCLNANTCCLIAQTQVLYVCAQRLQPLCVFH